MRRSERESSPAGESAVDYDHDAVVLIDPQKSRWERSWPTIACGAGKHPRYPIEIAFLAS